MTFFEKIAQEIFNKRNMQHINKINNQISLSKVLNLKYKDAKGVITTRVVEPYKIEDNSFWAYDVDKDSIRRFKIKNIKSVKEMKQGFVPREFQQSIGFPKEEHENIKKRLNEVGNVFTTRVSREYGKYKVGNKYTTEWGDVLTPVGIQEIDKIENHPFFNELTDEQKKILSKYPKIQLIKLERDKGAMTKTAALKKSVQLREHQQRAVEREGDSVIFAHPVGSGKTLSAIARFENLKKQGRAKKALVVVPASLRNNFAIDGINKFTNSSYNIIGNKQENGSKNVPFHDVDPSKDYNIISYEMFRKNPEKYILESHADTVLADEIQRVKESKSQTFDAVKRTRPMYKNFIGLTGSPTSNSIQDIIPLLDAATAGKHNLVQRIPEFEQRYIIRENNGEKDIKKRPVIGFRNKRELRKNLLKYIDYVDAEDIRKAANMPDKKIKTVNVPLSPKQAKIYKGMLEQNPDIMKMIVQRRYEKMSNMDMAKAFNKMVEMRKLMNSVKSVRPGTTHEDNLEYTPKMKRLLEDVQKGLKNPKDQEIISSFLRNGGTDDIEPYLKANHIQYGKFVGKDANNTEAMRNQAVQDYLKGKNRVMLLSGAGGEGLDLPNTKKVFMMDQHYNPERNNQIMARGIRSNGLADRPQKERVVDVTKYRSTMPKEFFGLKKSKYKTPDEVIDMIQKRKDEENQKFRDLFKG